MRLRALVILGYALNALALPTSSPYVLFRTRRNSGDWMHKRDALVARDAKLPVKIALTQSNLDQGEDLLMRVSHPDSEHYGKHYSMQEIKDLFAPRQDTIDSVTQWLESSGIHPSRYQLSSGRNWINFEATIAEAEALLQTQYKVYEHPDGNMHLACDEYSLPEHLITHVDYITPTIQFDRGRPKLESHLEKRYDTPQPVGPFGIPPPPGVEFAPNVAAGVNALDNCGAVITPECLRYLYSIPKDRLNLTTFGVVAYTPQAFIQSDLDKFYAKFAKEIPAGTTPIFDPVDGGVNQQTSQSFSKDAESNLDLMTAFGLVYPQSVTYYQVGDLIENGSTDLLLDAFDKSFCTYDGGDDSYYDPPYPDPKAGGYKGHDCGTYKPPAVLSVSYGQDEALLDPGYVQRQCHEFLKLGMAGVTVVYASGDRGVAGAQDKCCVDEGCNYEAPASNGTFFNPHYPATCPYVTTVGATRIAQGKNVSDPEVACEYVIRSGGGFSNIFDMPSYQSAAVASYFKNHKPPYVNGQYNNSMNSRGYPDVSANGAAYGTYVVGNEVLQYGTSASAPTFGSIITLINERRAKKGKASVGFVNPVMYANPSAFHDITSGKNPGCGTDGFSAVPGWDPVTGLGTPDFLKLETIFP